MASSKTLIAANLEALGAAPLAELLIEISRGNAAAQRRLRLALAGNAGAAEAGRAVLKRLGSIARAKTWLDSQKIKQFVADLEAQRRVVLELIGPSDPREAFELIWRVVACAESVFTRSDDGSGHLSAAFHAAARDLGPLAQRAGVHVEELAKRAFRPLAGDEHGIWDELIPILALHLGPPGLTKIRDLVQEWQAEPVAPVGARKRWVIGWSSAGPVHADEMQSHHRRHTATFMLQQIDLHLNAPRFRDGQVNVVVGKQTLNPAKPWTIGHMRRTGPGFLDLPSFAGKSGVSVERRNWLGRCKTRARVAFMVETVQKVALRW